MAEPQPNKDELAHLYQLRKAEWHLTRQLAMQSTWAMANLVLWPGLKQSGLHEPLHKPLADFYDQCKPGGRRMILVPRTHRKTYLLTYAHTVRRVVCDPDVRVLIVTALDGTAKRMMGVLKKQFTSNKSFAYFFPEFVFDENVGTQYDFIHPARVMIEQNPTVRVTYTGSPLIGNRADIIICDDAVAEDKVANPDLADKNNSHINELVPILDINDRYDMMFISGTPKSYNDYYAIASGKASSSGLETPAPVFEFIHRHSLEDANGNPDMNGKPILPTVFTREKLLQIRDQCAANPAQGEGYFYREYQTQVQAPSDAKFLESWFNTWIDPRMLPPTIFSGITVDSALKDEQVLFKGDNMVILVGHRDAYGNLYLTDGARSKGWRTEDFRRVLISMVQNPKNLGVQNFIKEKVGEGAIFSTVRGWFNQAQRPFVPFPIKVAGAGKKYLRITEALQGPAMGRKIFFVKGQFPEDLHRVIVDELIHLGQWGHDDAADALSLFFHPDVNVIPESKSKVQWKDVVSRPPQISTSWNNHAAAAHANPSPVSPNLKSGRLTPWGQNIDLEGDTFVQPGASPGSTEGLPMTPIIQKFGGPK